MSSPRASRIAPEVVRAAPHSWRGRHHRALHRHVVVGSASVAIVLLVMVVTELSSETWGMPSERKADGLLWQFNIATGTLGLVLLVAAMTYRPVRIMRNRPAGPVHLPWRRTIGIWAAIAVVVHVPGGLAIHTSGWRVWTPFESVFPWADGRSFDEFTIGYWMGLLAVSTMVPLAATSNNSAIKRLGALRWQRWHRIWVWVTYSLVAVHVVALQYGEFRNLRHVAITAMIFAVALAARLLARRGDRTRLAVSSNASAEPYAS